jgi:type IV pilus assembly protein PilE
MESIVKTRRGFRGFTLMELMIVVAVIAILAAIALPSYAEYIRRARRADARQALAQIQIAQEKWRANNLTYGTLLQLGVNANSPEGHYLITIPNNTATDYTITATAQGAQAADTGCASLTVTLAAGVETRTSVGGGNCWPN